MSDQSAILALPYLMPAQAQKHVTHNEALRMLDVLVQLSVLDRDRTLPPDAPAEGQRHIVGAGAGGAWAGKDGQIAAWLDGLWQFFAPPPGWQAVVLDRGAILVFDGSDWVAPTRAMLGVNATADATNRLAVSAEATLFNHAGAGHQLKLNKAAAGDTASLLYQTGYSGRAEMGLAGNDGFAIKVSADGSAWTTALSLAAGTGAADLAPGLSVAGHAAYHRGNVLGTAAQTGGVPTGAVIERGSNANGEYVRFADGTQICTFTAPGQTITAASGSVFRNGSGATWTFPAAFSAAPGVSGGAGTSDSAWIALGAPGTTSVNYRLFSSVSDGTARTPSLMAIGRWF